MQVPSTHTPTVNYRNDFPVFRQKENKDLAFLDSASSTQKPDFVLDNMQKFYQSSYANVHRGVYGLSAKATDAFELARQKIQHFMGASTKDEIILTSGSTEAINLVAHSFGNQTVNQGDEIILSQFEHHSNIVPWQLLGQRRKAVIKVVNPQPDASFNLESFRQIISKRTKIIAITHVSNSIGSILPVRDICTLAHEVGAAVVIDGCQAAPHIPVNVQEIGCDFYVLTGHKLYGPTGIGALFGRKSLLESMPPFLGGGHMIRSVSFEETTFAEPPARFEAGTSNIVGAVGLGFAIDYLNRIGFNTIQHHEEKLLNYLLQRLSNIKGLRILGNMEKRGPVVSIIMDSAHPHDIATILDQHGVAVRAGHHCAQPTMKWFDVVGTTRISLGLYNSMEDIDQLIDGLMHVKKVFG